MKFFNLLTACAIAAPLLFVSCSDDAVTTPDTGGVSVTFTLGVSAGPGAISRAVGDGEFYDDGLPGERDVKNAMIVIYDRPINYAYDDGKVVKVIYLANLEDFDGVTNDTKPSYFDPSPSFYPQTDVLNLINVSNSASITDKYKKELTIHSDELEVGKRYYAIALCNFGNMTSTFEGMPLKEFRDKVYTDELYSHKDENGNPLGISEYTDFRMTGINEYSFMWDPKANTKGTTLDLGTYLVQRLAARVDITFGEQGKDVFIDADGDIRLPVYTDDGNDGLKLLEENGNQVYFYLTDLQFVNAVENGMYLIERSSVNPLTPQNQGGAIYLDNEGWENYGGGDRNPTKFVYSPMGKSYKDAYSLLTGTKYGNLFGLIMGGFFGDDDETLVNTYYENKKSSSVVGYLPENTCSDKSTMLRIVGKTSTYPGNIFTTSRAIPADAKNDVVGDIPIRHNTTEDSRIMGTAVVRNTIYRLRIKVISNENVIYFRYYYSMPGEGNQREYVAAGFRTDVGSNTDPNPTIND